MLLSDEDPEAYSETYAKIVDVWQGSKYTSGIGPILSITSYLQLLSIQHVILAAILMKSCIAEGYYSRRYILQVLF